MTIHTEGSVIGTKIMGMHLEKVFTSFPMAGKTHLRTPRGLSTVTFLTGLFPIGLVQKGPYQMGPITAVRIMTGKTVHLLPGVLTVGLYRLLRSMTPETEPAALIAQEIASLP